MYRSYIQLLKYSSYLTLPTTKKARPIEQNNTAKLVTATFISLYINKCTAEIGKAYIEMNGYLGKGVQFEGNIKCVVPPLPCKPTSFAIASIQRMTSTYFRVNIYFPRCKAQS